MALTWTPVAGASGYRIYGAVNSFGFLPGGAPGFQHLVAALAPDATSWTSSMGISDPDQNWSYLVVAVDPVGLELARSGRVGEFDSPLELQ
jgi:hypothetical protein